MHIEFDETTTLPCEAVYDFIKIPADWPRLFRAFGKVTPRPDGWFKVTLRRFPIPLTARVTTTVPAEEVEWVFSGFWSGQGEVLLEATPDGTRITGYESIHLPALLGLGKLLEHRLESRFAEVWNSGWRRLHRIESSTRRGEPAE